MAEVLNEVMFALIVCFLWIVNILLFVITEAVESKYVRSLLVFMSLLVFVCSGVYLL